MFVNQFYNYSPSDLCKATAMYIQNLQIISYDDCRSFVSGLTYWLYSKVTLRKKNVVSTDTFGFS